MSRSKLKFRKIKCFECHEVRCFWKNCPKQKYKENKEETSYAINVVSEREIYDDIESVLTIYIGSSGDGWILDSACTFYICSNRSWFDTYKVVNDVILLGGNKGLYVVGTVRIHMYDRIVRILEIWHVLEIKKNLIFF